MPLHTRKTHSLSHNRVSIPGATYFLTLTTTERKTSLTTPMISEAIKKALRELHQGNDLSLLCGTTMPEHIHILIILGETLTLSQTIAKLKVVTKNALQTSSLSWLPQLLRSPASQ